MRNVGIHTAPSAVSHIHSTFLLFRPTYIYLWYADGDVISINSTNGPYIIMYTSSPISAVRKAPDTFTMSKLHPSKALVVEDRSMDFVLTVGNTAPPFLCTRFGLLYAVSACSSLYFTASFLLEKHESKKRY